MPKPLPNPSPESKEKSQPEWLAEELARVRQSEERYRQVVETVPGFIWLGGADGSVSFCNQRYYDYTGLTPEAALSGAWFDFIHPEDRDRILPALEAALPTGRETEVEYRLRNREGVYRWLLLRSKAVLTAEGKMDHWVSTAVDIEDRKQSEEALRDREQRLQLALETARLAMWEVDLTTDSQRLSPAGERMLGMAPGTFRNDRDWEERIHPEDREKTVRAFKNTVATGQSFDAEYRILWKDGSTRWLRSTGTPVRDAHGNLQRIIGTLHDITFRKEADDTIQQRNQRLQILSNSLVQLLSQRQSAQIVSGIFPEVSSHVGAEIFFHHLVSDDGRSLRLNAFAGVPRAYAEKIQRVPFGAPPFGAAAANRNTVVFNNIAHSDAPGCRKAREFEIAACVSIPLMVGEHLLGALSFASRSKTQFAPGEIEFLQLISGYVAMTLERARAEAALREAKRTAEEANRAKDGFIATLSHELRTPLTPALLMATSLETDEALDPSMREQIRIVRHHIELEARLIDDLLDVTKISRGKFSLRLKAVDLHELLERALNTVRDDIREKPLHLSVETAATHVISQADPTRLQQLFWNLLKNAIKFTPPGGLIRIRTFNPRPDAIAVEFWDSGIGIRPEHLERIFLPFEQGAITGNHHYGGLGLGLSISRTIADLHGGQITAASPGLQRGACFTVHLPVARSAEALPASPTTDAGSRSPAPALRILLVEDHAHTRDILARLLTRDGHRVVTASTCAEAEQIAGEAQASQGPSAFEVLISDLGLPDGNGLELVVSLKAAFPSLTAIALSGFGTEEDIRKSTEAGFHIHLTKPIGIHELRAALAGR